MYTWLRIPPISIPYFLLVCTDPVSFQFPFSHARDLLILQTARFDRTVYCQFSVQLPYDAPARSRAYICDGISLLSDSTIFRICHFDYARTYIVEGKQYSIQRFDRKNVNIWYDSLNAFYWLGLLQLYHDYNSQYCCFLKPCKKVVYIYTDITDIFTRILRNGRSINFPLNINSLSRTKNQHYD